MIIVLELVPVPLTDRFDAILPDGRILVRSRQPLFDGARKLAVLGYDPNTLIETRHRDSPIVAMRATIGEAAKWVIEETNRDGLRRVRWDEGRHGRRRSEYGPSGDDVASVKGGHWSRDRSASLGSSAPSGEDS